MGILITEPGSRAFGMSPATTRAPVTYVLDSEDRIVLVNAEWDRFARANGAPHLIESKILGDSLWVHVADATLRHLLSAVLAKVRRTHAPLTLPFRCDSPGHRRDMTLRIAGGHAGSLLVSALTIVERARPPIAVLAPATARDERRLRLCSWCHCSEVDGQWLEIEEAVGRYADELAVPPVPRVTHGLCPACATRLDGA